MATKFYSQIDMQVTPTASTHVTTKGYVDGLVADMKDPKGSARVATTEALVGTYDTKVFTMTADGALSIDGVSLALNNRVLIKNQAGAARTENGIYTVTTVGDAENPGVLTRAADFDESDDISAGCYLTIEEGTTNADSLWVLTTNDPITLDTSLLEFSKLAPTIYSAGDGIDITDFSVAVDVTDVIDTTKGLTESENNIQVAITTDEGLDFNVGTGALEVDVTDFIDTTKGLTETTNNIQVAITTDEGLDFNGGTGALEVDVTDIIDTDYGLTEDTNNIRINIESDGGIQFDASNKGLEVKLDGTSLSVGESGVKKNSYSSDITWSGSGPYTYTIAAATHGLGVTRNLDVKVYESNDIVGVDIAVDSSTGEVTITSVVDFSNAHVEIQ